jgi:cobalamin biosynthesis Mg chelatase CobN
MARRIPYFKEKSNISLIFTAFLVVMLLAISGCSSRKRNMEKSFEEEKSLSKVDSTAKTKSSAENNKKLDESSHVEESGFNLEYEGCDGDSITVTQRGPDGKVKSQTTIKGKGKATVSSNNKITDTKKAEVSSEKKEDESAVSVKKIKDKASIKKKKAITSERKGTSVSFWILIVVVLILIALTLYLNKRFKLVKRVTDYLFKLFNLRKKLGK